MMRLRRLGGVVGLAMLVVVFSAPAGLVQAAFSWHTEIVADNANAIYVSMALDSAGRPHISYRDSNRQTFNYAHYTGTSWVIEIVASGARVGTQNSIALDDQDHPHIAYSGNSDDRLKYARYTGTGWLIDVVDESITGVSVSLALDSAGRPHIAYSHHIAAFEESLKYAYHNGTDWVTMTLDDNGFTGWYASLVLDGGDQPHISYFDRGNFDLKYTYFANGSWATETVDGDGSTHLGADSMMALDSDGWPHISYLESDNYNLKYARRDGGGWHIQTVDTSGRIESTAIALDNTDHPHISYYDHATTALKYTYFDGAEWQFMVADGAVNVGWLPALKLDSDGLAHIAYNDYENGDVKYAHLTINAPPTVEAGGPYSGVEGSPITLQATVDDPESDELTTAWSYEISTADDGTTCAFGDQNQVETTFTCTDDGTFTITLTANDGLNSPVTDTAEVTISNDNPTISKTTATLARNQVTITVTATDPGANDVLTYLVDCNNDGIYEMNAGTANSAACPFNQQLEGSFTFGVQVSDDNRGEAFDTATVTIATNLCASDYTGVLRYTSTCQRHETVVTIPGDDGSQTVCTSRHNGLLRSPLTDACADHETSYLLPEDGPLNVCINGYTQTMRSVNDLGRCVSHEFSRVIAATEVGAETPPRGRPS